MIVFAKESNGYKRLDEYADYLWENQTASAYPRRRAAGYARRRRMNRNLARSTPKLDTYAPYSRSRAEGYSK